MAKMAPGEKVELVILISLAIVVAMVVRSFFVNPPAKEKLGVAASTIQTHPEQNFVPKIWVEKEASVTANHTFKLVAYEILRSANGAKVAYVIVERDDGYRFVAIPGISIGPASVVSGQKIRVHDIRYFESSASYRTTNILFVE